MSSQRAIAAAFFSLVIVVVLAAIIYTDHSAYTNTTNVYILQHDVPAGQIVAQGDFVQQTVHADEAEFGTAEGRSLVDLVGQTRYLINMHTQDILRKDDTTEAQKNSEVPVTLTAGSTPAFAVGDRIDIYAYFSGQTVLISGQKGVPVVALGPPVVVAVPSNQETYWVTVSFAKTELLATRSGGVLPSVLPSNNNQCLALVSLSGQSICDPNAPTSTTGQ